MLTPLPMPNAPLCAPAVGVPVRLSASMAAATHSFREARVPEMRLDGGLGMSARPSNLDSAAAPAAAPAASSAIEAAAPDAAAEVGGPNQPAASAAAKPPPPPPIVVPASPVADDDEPIAAVSSPQSVKFAPGVSVAASSDGSAAPLLATPKTSRLRAAPIAPMSPAPMPPKENIEWDPFRDEPLPPAAAGCGFAWRKGVVTAWCGGAGASPIPAAASASAASSAPDAEQADAAAGSVSASASVSASGNVSASGGAVFSFPSLAAYTADLHWLMRDVIADGPTKSFSFRRLQLLEAQFTEHLLNNDYREAEEQKAVAHRDFYNVRKVDNHVHHSACMNQKHMLRFIKHKYGLDFSRRKFDWLCSVVLVGGLISVLHLLQPVAHLAFIPTPLCLSPAGCAPRPTWSCCGATAKS